MAASTRLHQVLGVGFGVAVLIGSTIGVGILRTPGEVATHLPDTRLFVVAWVVGGLYTLLAAMSLAEPGTMIRRSGAFYPIVHRALGRYPGFVVGWTDWIANAASLALMAMVFAEFAAPLLPQLGAPQRVVASLVVLGFGVLQWRGVRRGEVTQQVLSAFKTVALTALAITALLMAVPAQDIAPGVTPPAGTAILAGFVLALQSIIYTYGGWAAPLSFGAETVNAGRTIPRAMITGVLTVLAIYLLINLSLLSVLGVERLAGDPFPAATVATLLFGAQGGLILRILVLGSILGAINAVIMFNARLPVAMSEDRLLPSGFATVNAGGTPTVAQWVTIGIALAFIITGTFGTVLALAAFCFVVNDLLSFASVFVLRRTEPDTPRPFRVPGFPFSTALVLLGSVAFLVGVSVSDPVNSLRAVVLLGLSYPVYRVMNSLTRSPHPHV